ncbi:MAG: hypothetical protein Q8L56_16510 [Rhodocyclaceae bacterium]|nr:hypothetical protein [Rhodocyclaceae bacterium]
MPDENLLGQADALIRRYRSFVARGPAASDNLPVTPDAPLDTETDIPLLTEVVAAATDQPATRLNENMRAALASEIDGWIGEALPAAVAKASQNMLTELETELETRARHTLLPHLLEILENGTRQKL